MSFRGERKTMGVPSEETMYEKLVRIYSEAYRNPEAALNQHLDELVKEGLTREEAILHLYNQKVKDKTLKQANEVDHEIARLTVLFSKGEITEESYKTAIKALEAQAKNLKASLKTKES